MRTGLRRLVAAAAVGWLLAFVPHAWAAQGSPSPVPVGQALPNAVMAGLNGPARALASYRGRPLIINVWASWCAPCRAEARSFERLAWSKAGARYTVIGISTDDYREEASKWLKQSNATISHYIDTGPHWPLENMLGASAVPLTVLVDAQGRVVARFSGARAWDTAESVKLIESAFASAGRPAAKP